MTGGRRIARVTLFCLGGLLLVVAAMVYAKEFAMGWPLSRAAVGIIVGGVRVPVDRQRIENLSCYPPRFARTRTPCCP